jgi:hypothetical protein
MQMFILFSTLDDNKRGTMFQIPHKEFKVLKPNCLKCFLTDTYFHISLKDFRTVYIQKDINK